MPKELKTPLFNLLGSSTTSKIHVFNNFLFFALGLSVGIVFTLCIKSFSLSSPAGFGISYSLLQNSTSFPPPPLRFLPPPPPRVKERYGVIHNMSDKELLLKASKVGVGEEFGSGYVPKVAFMFLTPGPLPLGPLWEQFFMGYQGLYSIYVHSHPSYKSTLPETSVFHGRTIPSQPVYWGTISMVDAERRLLANALLDFSNQRFVLLSDSCIPLFNFTTIYNYLIKSNQSNVGSFDDPKKPGRGRYNRKMWPAITIEQWRKGAQWFEVNRDLGLKIVSDQKYYDIFKQYCLPPCYNDEHYMPTLINILYPGMSSNRSVTSVDWSRGGPHPGKYRAKDISDELLNRIRYRSECIYNGHNTSICLLFARKFLPETLDTLLMVAPLVLGFDP